MIGKITTAVVLVTALLGATGALLLGADAGGGAPGKGELAATVKSVPEAEFGNIRLTPKAEERLGITTAAVERRSVPHRRVYGAELVLPPGQQARLVAPFSGMVRAPLDAAFVVPGVRVKRGQRLVGVEPILLEPDRLRAAELQLNLASQRAIAESDFRRTEAEVKMARANVERGSQLLLAEAGSQRAVQEARTALATAEAGHTAARSRREIFRELASTVGGEPGAPLSAQLPVTWMDSPLDGIVRDVPALPSTVVFAGGTVIDIADTSTLWARVPVSVDEAAQIRSEPARIQDGGKDDVVATVVEAPPTATATSATVDLYYRVPNADNRWTPGMRASASLPLAGAATSLVVPWSAVVLDVNGGGWVYARAAPGTYARRRVAVERIDRDLALLSTGPTPGTTIVTSGVPELFGLDVGYAK